MSILHHWGTVARLAPSCDVIVPEVPVPEPLVAFAAARLLWLARFFLFLPAFFPKPGAGFDCVERIIVAVVVVVGVGVVDC
jgi:hypothetical protein